jgi:hypothetical protein
VIEKNTASDAFRFLDLYQQHYILRCPGIIISLVQCRNAKDLQGFVNIYAKRLAIINSLSRVMNLTLFLSNNFGIPRAYY